MTGVMNLTFTVGGEELMCGTRHVVALSVYYPHSCYMYYPGSYFTSISNWANKASLPGGPLKQPSHNSLSLLALILWLAALTGALVLGCCSLAFPTFERMPGQLGFSCLCLPLCGVYVKQSLKDADNWFLEETEPPLFVSLTGHEIASFLIQRHKT